MKISNSHSSRNLKNRIGCFNYFRFAFVIGWLTIALLLYNASKIIETKSWTPTEAIVQNVETKITRTGRHKSTFLKLKYNYEVNNSKYDGKSLTRSIFDKNQVHRVDNIYRIHKKLEYAKKVQIYYNPKNPNESVVINQFINIWFFYVWFVLFINSIIYALKFSLEGKSKLYVIMPVLIGICWFCHYTIKLGYSDTSSMITVIEKYESNDCKFAKKHFDESVYINVNNYRMERNDDKFNRNSTIKKVNILESTNISNNCFQTIAEVVYSDKTEKIIIMKLEYEKMDVCWFSFQNIEILN